MLNFENRPTYQELRNELQTQICIFDAYSDSKYIDDEELKKGFTVKLSKKYSHKAIKQVLRFLGYRPTTRKPEREFKIRKITKKS